MKKKKKKKTEIEDTEETEIAPEAPDELFSGKKKKSKKPKASLNIGDVNAAVPVEAEVDTTMDFNKKKKRKDKEVIIEQIVADTEDIRIEDAGESDYTYEELLQRVFELMMEKNPEMITGERKKLVMPPPQVARVGTKKTMFINFDEICRQLRRPHRHLLSYLFAELGTNGSLDGNNQLIIKGRYQVKHIENVLRTYVREYVMCHTCKSTDTELTKDIRLFFLQCRTCGSKCSVVSIKSGFQAVTGKRAAIRAKVT